MTGSKRYARALIYLASVLGIACAGNASATPPDFIEIRDTPFAANAQSVFVIRQTTDNLGLHHALQVERFLVEIDVDSGKETLHPIYRGHRIEVWNDRVEDNESVATVSPSPDWVNPYRVIADKGAFPLSFHSRSGTPADVRQQQDGDAVILNPRHGPQFAFSVKLQIERLVKAAGVMAVAVSNASRMSTQSTHEVYAQRTTDPETCLFRPEGWWFGNAHEPVQLVRITCHEGEELELTSLLFPVRGTPREG